MKITSANTTAISTGWTISKFITPPDDDTDETQNTSLTPDRVQHVLMYTDRLSASSCTLVTNS